MKRGRLWSAARVAAVIAAGVIASGCAGGPREARDASGARIGLAPPPQPMVEAAPAPLAAERALAGKAFEAEPAAEVTAAGTLATQPVLRGRPPQLLARLEGPDLEALPFVVDDVTVVIVGHRARVVFDMVFANPSPRTLAATLMIGLPDRASPCFLSTFEGGSSLAGLEPVDLLSPEAPAAGAVLGRSPALAGGWKAGERAVDWGGEKTAVVVEPVRGRQVYEAVTRARIDPALAEWAGSGTFSARIYPLAPSSLKRVVFAYDQTLPPSAGRVVLPLPSPAAAARLGRITVREVGAQLSRASVSAGGVVLDPQPGAGPGARLWLPDPAAAGDLVFEGALRSPSVSVLAGADPAVPGTLASVLLTPELPPRSLVSSTGRALFVLDTSASGRDALFGLSGQMLRRILETDDSITEFAVVAFDLRAVELTPGFVANSAEARASYLAEVERIRLSGATSFASLVDFLRARAELLEADTCFLLSDGEITWGEADPAALLEGGVASRRWICYDFGGAPHNQRLFAALTRAAGRIVRVAPAQDLDEAARAHRSPVFHLEWVRSSQQDEVVVSGDPALLYPGQVIEIALRTSRPLPETRLVMRIDGRDVDLKVALPRTPLTDPLAARAWAETFVGELLGQSDEAARRVVFALSSHFALSNDLASFLILDNDEQARQHGVVERSLDFREIRRTLAQRRAPVPAERVSLSGLDIPHEMPTETAAVVRSLAALPRTPAWDAAAPTEAAWTPRVLTQSPRVAPPRETPVAIYEAARSLRAGPPAAEGKADAGLDEAQALRTLSTIAELAPRDDRALRLVGFALIEWGFYDEAARLFGAVRSRRPFEPQNLLLEAIAQSALGDLGAAALRYELVLSGSFARFGEESQAVARRLYVDLLRSAARAHPDHPLRAAWQRRLDALEEEDPELSQQPGGRLLLFWNLDDTDVDLHVREGLFSEVWYERMSSRSGGRLFWDNTEGLGPELYEHPRLSRRGFRVSVDYFGSSSVEGEAPAATFVAAFASAGGGPPHAAFYTTVLSSAAEDRVQIMPAWKRPR